MKRVKRFGIYQTSKVVAVIYFIITAIVMIPFGLFSAMFGTNTLIPGVPINGGIVMVFLPFIYAIAGFIFSAISCFVYNIIAQWTGGIEVEIETTGEINEVGNMLVE